MKKPSERRSPCGERGLKCPPRGGVRVLCRSLPVRGAWIEILLFLRSAGRARSLPVRGAWIEILRYTTLSCTTSVAPRAGSVD